MKNPFQKPKTDASGGAATTLRKGLPADIVGVDLFTGDPRGCPAVRLAFRKGAWRVAAAGFVPPPAEALPDSWEAAAKKCTWSLPAEFQAPAAALAVSSGKMFFAQTTTEAFRSDLASGAHSEEGPAAAAKPSSAAGKEKKGVPARLAAEPNRSVPDASPGKPVSNGGTRFVMRPMKGTRGFLFEAGLPEYQLLWLSRLLPEGRRPTARSVQLHPSALAAALLRHEAVRSAGGTAFALIFGADAIHIAGYCRDELVLWRNCRNLAGWRDLHEQVKSALGLEEQMVENVLDDSLIDPRPILERALTPVLAELGVSRDYLMNKFEAEPKTVLVVGLPTGFAPFASLIRERLRLEAVEPDAFEGFEGVGRLKDGAARGGVSSHVFLGAIGAALSTHLPDHLNLLSETEHVSSSPLRLRVLVPLLAGLACLGLLTWWLILLGRILLIDLQTNAMETELGLRNDDHAKVLLQMARGRELLGQVRQLDGYRLSRRTWGQKLTCLAETIPPDIQLTRLRVGPPPPPKRPAASAPTDAAPGTTERITFVLAGRTTSDAPLFRLMESLDSPSFTNALEIVRDPTGERTSPRVRSFYSETTASEKTSRFGFEISYRAGERRFAR